MITLKSEEGEVKASVSETESSAIGMSFGCKVYFMPQKGHISCAVAVSGSE